MEPLLSYSVGLNPKYNILFEKADCTLQTYLFDKNNFPNGDIMKRLKNVDRMIALADGLVWLHKKLMKDSNSGSYKVHTFEHCDLRLENLLVWYDNSSGEYIFKLNDFGNAQMSTSQPEPSHWHPRKDEKVPQKRDVWSFGCILLLVIIFNYEGDVGLIEFLSSLDRDRDRDRDREGTSFYDSKAEKPNTQTTSCIQSLKNRIETESDKIVTGKILGLLENKIFKPLKRRAEIESVHTEMALAYDEEGLVIPIVMGRKKPKSVSNFNHCAQSPNGEFEVFHGDETGYTLIVWRHEMAAPLRSMEPLSPPESKIGSRIYPHSVACGTNSICQVVTNKNRLEVYIL
jgi:serine/threonine protein kinase